MLAEALGCLQGLGLLILDDGPQRRELRSIGRQHEMASSPVVKQYINGL
jgi:hypothetical protein